MKKTIFLGLTTITLALASSTARAGDVRVSFHVGLPLPRVYVSAPAPVCAPAPAPVYVAPPVVYVQPRYCHPGFITHRGHIKHARYYHNGHRYYCHY